MLRRSLAIAAISIQAAVISPALSQGVDPSATGSVSGFTMHAGKKGERQHYSILLDVNSAASRSDPGSVVAFGAMDSGEVVWMAQTDYRPSLRPGMIRRNFITPKAPLTLEQTPRYLMVCAWHLDNERKPVGKPFAGYAERNDSGASYAKPGREEESLTVHWVPVPPERARSKFAKTDYCGEVLRTQRTSVPHWLKDATAIR